MARLPERFEDGDGLVLRRWTAADVPALDEAIRESLEHLRPWMHWAAGEPLERAARERQIAEWADAWRRGGDVVLGAFLDGEVVGGCGLHRRLGPHALEIGYWIRASRVRQGLATRVAGLLADAALALPGIRAVEIHHDEANAASGGVPRRLHFEHVGCGPDEKHGPAEAGIEHRWRRTR